MRQILLALLLALNVPFIMATMFKRKDMRELKKVLKPTNPLRKYSTLAKHFKRSGNEIEGTPTNTQLTPKSAVDTFGGPAKQLPTKVQSGAHYRGYKRVQPDM